MLIDYLAALRRLLEDAPEERTDAPRASPESFAHRSMRICADDDPREWAQYGIGAF